MTGVTAAEHAAMARARELALRGPRGINPQVGAVVLARDGAQLSEGFHRGAGTPHAEIDALRRLSPDAARGATIVVTLEPCNHTGRTGPCAAALIELGIARVVYAAADPGSESGAGAVRLQSAGIEVARAEVEAGEALIADWLFSTRNGRPRITAKWAQSLDGRAAAEDGTSRWITGAAARQHVHVQRAAHDAIAVGTGTILADDPALTARFEGAAQPLPVVFGTRDVPEGAKVREHPRGVRIANGELDAELSALARDGIQSLYVEGGPTLVSSLIRADLVDVFHVYLAPTLLGGQRLALGELGIHTIAAQRRLAVDAIEKLGDDILVIARPER